MVRDVRERLMDMRDAAIDLLDFVSDMDTDAFHALPHADRMLSSDQERADRTR